MQFYINLNSANNFVRFAKETDSNASRRLETPPSSTFSSKAKAGASHTTASSSGGGTEIGARSTSDGNQVKLRGAKLASNQSAAMAKANEHHDNSSKHQERPFDVIIFAASGSVGRFLVEEMALVVDKHYSAETSALSVSPSSAAGDQVDAPTRKQFAQRSQQQHSRRRSVPSSSNRRAQVRWAVAGRSAVRLSETLCQAELSAGVKDLSSSIPIVLADLNHQRSLLEMCRKTSLVVNCAGPYSELGAELLIEACIECATNYIDLSSETTLVERISSKYCERARDNSVFILNGCGFQSMSAEMGLNFTKQVADGRIEQVKIILSLSDTKTNVRRLNSRPSGLVSEGMWNSLLCEKGQEVSVEERLRLRAQSPDLAKPSARFGAQQHVDQFNEETCKLMQQTIGRQPDSASTPSELVRRKDTRSLVQDIVQFRNRNVSTLSWPLQFIRNFQSRQGRGYCWPIDNLTSDESQLIRGEMNNYELRQPDSDGWRPIRCTTFLSVRHFTHLCLLCVWLFLFELLAKFTLARFVMRKLAGLVSLGHVASSSSSCWHLLSNLRNSRQQQQPQQSTQLLDRDSLSHIKYCQTFIAYGTPGDESGDPLEDRRRGSGRQSSQVQLLVARIVGPEPNHVATATFCVQAAITMIMERDHLPGPGGVLTPGAAFAETNIIYQLRRRNIKFEVLKKA